MERIADILRGLNKAGIIRASEQQVCDLALNTWIIVTSWFSFLRCHLMDGNDQDISQEMLKGGIYQVLSLERPFFTAEYLHEIDELQQLFAPKPDWQDIK
ncbi:MAG: TetR/AcrR family transcriptional regulator [Oleibacter sp.]|nr:TetR/AcrR family transcriptional regulator [Thalassolituus sp.]